jgi:hypothetical protein
MGFALTAALALAAVVDAQDPPPYDYTEYPGPSRRRRSPYDSDHMRAIVDAMRPIKWAPPPPPYGRRRRSPQEEEGGENADADDASTTPFGGDEHEHPGLYYARHRRSPQLPIVERRRRSPQWGYGYGGYDGSTGGYANGDSGGFVGWSDNWGGGSAGGGMGKR